MTTTDPTADSHAHPTTQAAHGYATWRNLGLAYLAGCVLLAIQSLGYHHWSHGDNDLASDVPFYLVSGLIGAAIAALGIVRVRTSRRASTTSTVGIVLPVLGLIIFPVAYYMPITFIWGATGYLLGRDAAPGARAKAARTLGLIAMLCQVAVVVARLVGVTYQVGG